VPVFQDLEIRDKRHVPVVIQHVEQAGMRVQLTLLHAESGRFVTLLVDAQAGAVIQLLSNKDELPVPLPQQLVAQAVKALGAKVAAGIVTELGEGGAYMGLIRVDKGGRYIEIPSRASDAIAVALAGEGELLASPDVLSNPV
jgi:bifunctional DNase/RNase